MSGKGVGRSGGLRVFSSKVARKVGKKKLQDIHPSKAKTIKCSLIARWNIKRTYSIVRSKRM